MDFESVVLGIARTFEKEDVANCCSAILNGVSAIAHEMIDAVRSANSLVTDLLSAELFVGLGASPFLGARHGS
jgi:hypothetical protein